MKPLWLYRPLLNWQDIYTWGIEQGIKKMMPPEQLHLTLATVREPVEWGDLDLKDDILIVPAGYKIVQIFGYTVKALAFGHPKIKERHEGLIERFPEMDHPLLRPHVTLFRGGKMPKAGYEGDLIFGPEIADEFNEELARNVKHIKIAEYSPLTGRIS